MEKFSTFFHNGQRNLLPNSHGKKIIWSNLFKPLKDTISKTNTCFRQHHDNVFLKKTFQSKDFRNSDKTHKNHSTWQNSWSYVIIRELQARKHNQFSAIKNVFSERQDSEKTNISWHQIEYWSFLETKISFKTLNLWQQHKGHEISKKLSRKRWQVINSLTPLFSKFESKRSRIEAFQQISHLIFWNLHLVSKFENSN
jgi:hypothetical protein